MSTLADELLQDFGDTGSEGEDGVVNGILKDDVSDSRPAVNVNRRKAQYTDHDGGMELDGDEDSVGDADEEMENAGAVNGNDLEADDDEEEAKAKVARMQLGDVDDVRSVAGLMETLEPVLEVSRLPSAVYFWILSLHLYSCTQS